MAKHEKPFWRSSNAFRLIGFVMIIAGQFLPMGEFNLLGLAFPSNMIQVVGVLLFMWPMGREAFGMWRRAKLSVVPGYPEASHV